MIDAGAGDDTVEVSGNVGEGNRYYGGTGTDTFSIISGLTVSGNTVIDGFENLVTSTSSQILVEGVGSTFDLSGITNVIGGNAYIYGREGGQTLIGTNDATHTDHIYGGSGDDRIDGGAGDDIIAGGFGNDTLDGGIGDDSITGGEGNDSIVGGDGNDWIDGGAGGDTISAGDGNDTIIDYHDDATDVIHAGAGDDTVEIIGYVGDSNEYYGGDGNDTLIITGNIEVSGNTVVEGFENLATTLHSQVTVQGEGSTFDLSGITNVTSGGVNIYGGEGSQTLHGTNDATFSDNINGGGGNAVCDRAL